MPSSLSGSPCKVALYPKRLDTALGEHIQELRLRLYFHFYVGYDPTGHRLFLEMYSFPGMSLLLAARASEWGPWGSWGFGPRPSSFLILRPSLGEP